MHKTLGIRLGYGDLAQAAMALPTPARDVLRFKDEKEFRYVGKGAVQIYDLHDITTGKAVYAADVSLPGMKYAVVARPPVVGGTVKSVDDAAAKAIPGVEAVVQIPGAPLGSKFKPLGGVAVVATNTWAAIQGRDALVIEWDDGPHASYTTAAYEEELRASAEAPGAAGAQSGRRGSGARRRGEGVHAANTISGTMVHAPMEPPAALANFADGKCEVWGCLQSPYGARVDIAEFLGIEPKDVTVNVTLLGGGFGRKSKCDFAIEAAYLSREVGAPVRVQWTREDDIQHSFHHTTSVERIEIGLDAREQAGRLAASERAAVVPVDLRAGRGHAASGRDRHGPRGHAVRHPERPRRAVQGDGAYADRLVTARCRTSRAPSRSSRSWRSSPPSSAATRRTFCSR